VVLGSAYKWDAFRVRSSFVDTVARMLAAKLTARSGKDEDKSVALMLGRIIILTM
jgi:hypothetical protein